MIVRIVTFSSASESLLVWGYERQKGACGMARDCVNCPMLNRIIRRPHLQLTEK
jgi:hypothetical protein